MLSIQEFYANHHRSQKPKHHRRRAPPPSLVSLDKLNPYTSASASNASSPSSSYLTPPVTNVPLSSPPPQLIAEDYLNARTAHRQRRTGNARRAQSSFHASMDSMAAQDSTFTTSDIDSEGRRSNDSQLERLPGTQQATDKAERILKNQPNLGTLSAPAAAHLIVKGDLAVAPSSALEPGIDSTASDSLRRMSQVVKEPSLFGSRHLRRLSQAIVAAVQYPTGKHGAEDDNDPNANFSVPGIRTDDTAVPPVDNEPHRRESGSQKSTHLGFETPATITLRKASDAYYVMIGETTADGGTSTVASLSYPPKPRPDPKPSIALMNFRSQRVADRKKSLWYSLPLLSNQDENLEGAKRESDQSNTTMNEAIHDSLSTFGSLQGASTVVEPATTYTDVYTAPQTFASVPLSTSSSSTLSKVRRTSTIHIKSRTSVHEIIWREQETSSGSSSPDSESPAGKNKGSQTLGTITPTTPKAITTSRSAPTTPRWHLDSPRLQALPEENLFEWSWEAKQAMAASSNPKLDDLPSSAAVSYSAPTTPPRRRSISKESGNSSVESFPPLMDRKNTTEWRVAPLVDLNDPMAGRVTRMWVPQVRTEGSGGSSNVSEDRISRGESERRQSMDGESGDDTGRVWTRRASAHPYAVPRLGPSGRMGSSIGASGHKKMVCFV